jgi:hypothetical protein
MRLDAKAHHRNELRALAGVREAVRQRLEAVRTPGEVEVSFDVVMTDGTPLPVPPGATKPCVIRLRWADYWRGVPSRYRDPDRYTVAREMYIRLPGLPRRPELIAVHSRKGRLVWTSDGRWSEHLSRIRQLRLGDAFSAVGSSPYAGGVSAVGSSPYSGGV